MSLKQFIPAIKYGNTLSSDELDPNASLSNGQINQAIAQTASVTLTAANITSLSATPVQIVTTTVSGTAIVVDSIFFETVPTTTTFSCPGAANVQFQYGTTTTTGNIMGANIPQNAITSGSAGYFAIAQSSVAGGVIVVPNAGITIGQTGPAFATGTGTAKVTINYYIVTL